MWISSMRWWQGMILGTLAGLAVALVALSGGEVGAGAVGMGQAEFERLLQAPPALGKYPALDEICVLPVGEGYWVRMLRRYPLADGSGFEYRQEWLALRGRDYRPMDTALREGGAGEGYTVRTFLESMSARDARVKFRYAWEKDARVALPVFVLGGALLLGVVWPVGVRIVLGRKSAESLTLVGTGQGGEQNRANRAAGPTAEEMAQLTALEAEMEARLATDSVARPAPATGQGEHGAKAPVLDAGPLEMPPCAVEKAKRFDGEYYPTETHVKRDE